MFVYVCRCRVVRQQREKRTRALTESRRNHHLLTKWSYGAAQCVDPLLLRRWRPAVCVSVDWTRADSTASMLKTLLRIQWFCSTWYLKYHYYNYSAPIGCCIRTCCASSLTELYCIRYTRSTVFHVIFFLINSLTTNTLSSSSPPITAIIIIYFWNSKFIHCVQVNCQLITLFKVKQICVCNGESNKRLQTATNLAVSLRSVFPDCAMSMR